MVPRNRPLVLGLAGLLVVLAGCAAQPDRDTRTSTVAARTPRASAHVTAIPPQWVGGSMEMTTPELFIHVDGAVDASKRLPPRSLERASTIIRRHIQRAGYMTEWPGRLLPTSSQLDQRRSRAFIVSATVSAVDVHSRGARAEITCKVAVRVAPWKGVDGGEAWQQRETAAARGSAKATTSTAQIERGMHDCAEAVIDQVTAHEIVPFLQRVAPAR